MRRISLITRDTPEFNVFVAQEPDASWKVFRSSPAYQEVRQLLIEAQGGLCAYCEINLYDMRPNQIEHYLPKHKDTPSGVLQRRLSAKNMMACCLGGTEKTMLIRDTLAQQHPSGPWTTTTWATYRQISPFSDHFMSPAIENTSCGAAKDDSEPDGIWDPRFVPLNPLLFKFKPDGGIDVESILLQKDEIEADRILRTIRILRLDCPRLVKARRRVIDALEDEFRDEPITETAAGVYLSPDARGYLHRFWTTVRCFFGSYAERWISEQSLAVASETVPSTEPSASTE